MGETLNYVLTIAIVISALMGVFLVLDTIGSLYYDGVPKTYNGHVIFVSHNYNKFYDYDWTDVEILTYSGDSHHVFFWGHIDFKLRENYHIYTELDARFFGLPIPTWHSKQLILELGLLETSRGSE